MRSHGTGTKRFRHHDVGELTLDYQTMTLNAEPAAPTPQSLTATSPGTLRVVSGSRLDSPPDELALGDPSEPRG